MSTFTIEGFAASCKQAMAAAEEKQQAAHAHLARVLEEHDAAEIIETLNAAIPAGASIGEMIVHRSPELTMLYARVPARFQSGIHNHTVFACIGQLAGEEHSVLYERTDDGRHLRILETRAVEAGGIMDLPADVIHHIENPGEETGHALHLYGGDFAALMDARSLWSTEGWEEGPFSFERLVDESIVKMKRDGNERGIAEVVKAIPAAQALVDSLRT